MTSSPLQSAALPANSEIAPYLACVAGEPSGDMLASSVLAAIANNPDLSSLRTRGIGGPKMMAQGFESLWPMDTLAVRGYVEAIKQLPAILSVRQSLLKELMNHRPQAYLGIDAPDFNLGVEKKLKAVGIPTIHFISPSIWAWRGGRIKGIKESVDHMLCIFPFEPKVYEGTGIQATYVGHPLASSIPMVPDVEKARQTLSIAKNTVLVAVLPGSRKSEVAMIGPGFFESMGEMLSSHGEGIEFVVPIATPTLRPAIEALANQIRRVHPSIIIHLLDGQASLALEAADVVLIASGTATLEAALWKKPMVISYKVPAITAWLMKKQAYLPYVGLPNILAGEFVVPELLQEAATPKALAEATLRWLDQSQAVNQLKERFTVMHESLRLPTGQLVADVIAKVIHARKS
jgi:lipid-A-disaccharide synthase